MFEGGRREREGATAARAAAVRRRRSPYVCVRAREHIHGQLSRPVPSVVVFANEMSTLSMRWREAGAPELVPTHLALGYPVSVLSHTATEGGGYGVRGRSVVVTAGSAIAAGEVALVAQPYAVAVDQPFLRKVCLGCATVSDKQLALVCEVTALRPMLSHPLTLP